ncbi:TetR/AcrR family transcriptional regulator [Patulibacter minatonensis]|uniref:TetR/AcrR family transcriptional regulator n=1 Tax=Patulibacter minatonensis TaxID=298163 RepID=UPI00068497B6|nr:TetR/AcrR family transcriptional regulator [Patulibacter minatonensis]
MGSVDHPTRRRADAVANREALLTTARALFAQRGLDVSYDDISREAGVGRATLYRHFPTREHLHDALLDGVVAEIEAAAAALPPDAGSFELLFRAALRVQTDNLALYDLFPSRGELGSAVLERRGRIIAVLREPLARAQEAGLARADLEPEDVRIQLLMLSTVVRPDVAEADRRRAWRLARLALGLE